MSPPHALRGCAERDEKSGQGTPLRPRCAGEDITLPEGAKAGSLVILRVPEAACIASWSEAYVGGAVGYAPGCG